MRAARHTGSVSHLDEAAGYAEIAAIGRQPISVDLADLRRIGADTFVVVEKWESLDHLGAHARSPHMAAYAAKTRDLLANREIHVCQPAA